MHIYFLRHGRADRSAWDGPDDLRPLTPEGKERMHREAATMARMGLQIDVILSSPLMRARQTAEIAAQGMDLEDVLAFDERLASGFNVALLREILQERKGIQGCMLVGHEPDFSMTIEDLVGGGSVVVRKGALARVDVDPRTVMGELIWLIPAKVLIL